MISGVVVLRTRHGLRCRPRVTASALSAAGRADLGGGGFPTRLSRICPGGNALERPNVIVTIRFAGCAIDESEMFEIWQTFARHLGASGPCRMRTIPSNLRGPSLWNRRSRLLPEPGSAFPQGDPSHRPAAGALDPGGQFHPTCLAAACDMPHASEDIAD
jgi:hypothetical protein